MSLEAARRGRTARRRRAVAVAVAALVAALMSACSSGGSGTKAASVAPAVTPPAAATCQAVQVGPFTRCENFYTAFWPTIEKNMQSLYKQALATDGGQFVDWGWYQLPQGEISLFTKAFPGIKVQTRGLTYNLSSAIVSANATGARSSDIVAGSITSMASMYDEGYWQKVDWTQYGVPKEFLAAGTAGTGLLPKSFNGWLINYNADKAGTIPSSLDDLTAPQWKGKIAMESYNAQFFVGYGMTYGQAKMVSLIKQLKSSGNLQIVNDTTPQLSTGDVPLALSGQSFSSNPAIQVAPFDADELFAQFSGVNTKAGNPAAAMLFALWDAYDPTWLKARMTDPAFASQSMPFIGLPSSVFAEATGTIKLNVDAWLASVNGGNAVYETMSNRDQILGLIKAATAAVGN